MKKKSIWLFIGLLQLASSFVFAQMSGAYTIGSGGAYTTISGAIADMNTEGLSGDVTLNVGIGTYSELIDLSSLNNGTFTVTIEGEDKETTIIAPPNQDAATIRAGIIINGTNNVILRNMTLDMDDISSVTDNVAQGIYINEAYDITIEECILVNTATVVDDEYEIYAGIYLKDTDDITIASNQFEGAAAHIRSGLTFEFSPTHDGVAGNNLILKENAFAGGLYGLLMPSHDDFNDTNFTIEQNEFNNQTYKAIRIDHVEGLDINNNKITLEGSHTEVGAMSIVAKGEGNRISNNIINVSNGIGIYLIGTENTQVYNNIVSVNDFALWLSGSDNLEIVHNTLHSEDDNPLVDVVVWFDLASNNVSLINNIFSGVKAEDGEDNNIAIMFNSDHTNLVMDYNLFDADLVAIDGYSTTTTVNGTTVFEEYSFSEWNTLVGLDGNSVSTSPEFLEDFRIGSTDYRFGIYLADYAEDIDGELRVDGAVDVGADQYCDAIEVTEDIAVCVSYEFDGQILTESGEYFGTFTATNKCDSVVTLNLTILEPTEGSEDVMAIGSYDWNGTIYAETGSYEQTLTNQVGCDSTATLNLTIEPYYLEGDFIIGSSLEADFANFTEAIADLQYATLIGDVTYSIETGTYNETLEVNTINSGDYKISFIGEDKATTILHPMGNIEESGSGIFINRTNKVTIQNLTLEMDDISEQKVFYGSGNTKGISVISAGDITLDNLVLKNNTETSDHNSSQFYIVVGLYADNVDNLLASNSSFSGAGSHITLGIHTNAVISDNDFQTAREVIRNTSTGTNLLIENNDFTGPFDDGINLSSLEGVTILSNDIDGIDQTSSSFAIRLDETSGSMMKWNTIKNAGTGIDLNLDNLSSIEQNMVFFLEYEAIYSTGSTGFLLANNFIGDMVFLSESTNLDLVHNTIVCTSDRDQSILMEDPTTTTGTDHTIINNIIVGGDQVENLLEMDGVTDNSTFTIDHNLYFLEDNMDELAETHLVHYNGTGYTTLVDWQDAQVSTSFDLNSQSFEPAFTSSEDFHIASSIDYRFGKFISDVTTDIDGHLRDELIGIDVGADQDCGPCTIIWDGSWSNVVGPTESDHAMVNADYSTANNGEVVSNNLTVSSGFTLVVNEETFLEVNGELLNEGTIIVKSGGSLITFGDVYGSNYQIERTTTFDNQTGKYSMVGSPVVASSFDVLSSNWVFGYDETEAYHVDGNEGADRFKTPFDLGQTTMQSGLGYFSAYTGDENGLVTFVGTPNTGDVTVDLTFTDQGDASEVSYQGFNLVSNPYPSAIGFTSFMEETTADITGSIYLWDDYGSDTERGTNADYLIVNAMGNTDSRGGADAKWDGYIRSGQGFFVQANSSTSLTFTDAMRQEGNNTDGGYYRLDQINAYKLIITDGQVNKATVFGYASDATLGADKSYDAMSLNGGGLQIYTLQVDGEQKLGIQGLPANYKEGVKLGYSTLEAGEFTIMLSGEVNESVILFDKLLDQKTDLSRGSYTFSSQLGDYTDRFVLMAPEVVTGIDRLKEIRSYSTDGYLHLLSDEPITQGTQYQLINLMGRSLIRGTVNRDSNKVDIYVGALPRTVYILQLIDNKSAWRGKVILK